jgi:VanZ family protein
VLVVFGAPYVGDIRGALQTSFPNHYRSVIGTMVAIAVLAALVSAAVRIRSGGESAATRTGRTYPGWLRYSLLGAAVVIGVVYTRLVSTGNFDVDVVEAFHFVEYGLIGLLFYRACRHRPDVGALVLPASVSLLVGIVDEYVQWFVPGRVGELHDVWLNAVAVGCGLLLSVAIHHPPASLALSTRRSSRAAIASVVGLVILVGAAFVDRVHLGHEIADERVGVFRSGLDAQTLTRAAVERPATWLTAEPPTRGLAREDHYLSEGLWHVQQRNIAISGGDAVTAWYENLILEKYYPPVLERGARLAIEQRRDLERRVHNVPSQGFVSTAHPYPIYTISRGLFWTTIALAIAVVIWVCLREPSRKPVDAIA